MARKNDIPADMWLHVALDALARYAADGGMMTATATIDEGGAPVVAITMSLLPDDSRIPATFAALIVSGLMVDDGRITVRAPATTESGSGR